MLLSCFPLHHHHQRWTRSEIKIWTDGRRNGKKQNKTKKTTRHKNHNLVHEGRNGAARESQSRRHWSSPVHLTVQVCGDEGSLYSARTHAHTHAQQGFTTDIYNKDEKFVFGPNQPVRRRLTADRRFCHTEFRDFCVAFSDTNVTAEKMFPLYFCGNGK